MTRFSMIQGILTLAFVVSLGAGCGTARVDAGAIDAGTAVDGATGPLAATVSVDLGTTRGPVPYLYRLGFAYGCAFGDGATALPTEQQIGTVRLDMGWGLLSDATSLTDVQERLTTSSLNEVARAVETAGGEVDLMVGMMPRYLSSCPSDTAVSPSSGWAGYQKCPPTSEAEWAKLAEVIVKHFNVTLGLRLRYEVWNEPDLDGFWSGTPTDLFALYRGFVLGARRADPTAKIGGPALNDPLTGTTTWPIVDGLLEEWVAYCAATPLPELGMARLPIDFVVWHEYAFSERGSMAFVTRARTLLDRSGYPDSTILVDEWNAWPVAAGGPDSPVHADAEWNAARSASRVLVWRQAGLDRHAFFALGDNYPDLGEFHGDFGLFTRNGVRKAAYNAFRALGTLAGNEATVTLDGPDPFFHAAASTTGTKAAVVIVSGPVPDPATEFGDAVRYKAPTQAVLFELRDFAATLDSGAKLALADGTTDVATLMISDAAKDAVRTGQAAYLAAQTWMGRSATVQLSVSGIPAAARTQRRYVIDSTHSNAYRVWAAAKAAGASDDAALAKARSEDGLALVEITSLASGGSVVTTLQIESAAVVLLTWEP